VLAAPVEEARTYVHEQKVAHLDETSWRQGNKGACSVAERLIEGLYSVSVPPV
jgi:hypothetical protein